MYYIVRNRSNRSRIYNIRYCDLSDCPHLRPCLCCIGFRTLYLTMSNVISQRYCHLDLMPIIRRIVSDFANYCPRWRLHDVKVSSEVSQSSSNAHRICIVSLSKRTTSDCVVILCVLNFVNQLSHVPESLRWVTNPLLSSASCF
jgi:hypothetical protein